MSKVMIVAHHQRADAATLAADAATWLTDHDHVPFMPAEDAKVLHLDHLALDIADPDLVLSLGGDLSIIFRTIPAVLSTRGAC